jgi:hypothetical protein
MKPDMDGLGEVPIWPRIIREAEASKGFQRRCFSNEGVNIKAYGSLQICLVGFANVQAWLAAAAA